LRKRAAALLVLLVASAAPAGPSSSESAADAVAAEVLAAGPQQGMTIAVARAGAPVFAKGYGEADVHRHVAASAGTVYPICSISKNFAAAAVLKLAEQGKIDLDAPISRYFAKDPLPGRRVTVRQLLNHTSGAGSYNDGPAWDALKARALPPDEMLALIAAAEYAEPGRGWAYSNSAFYLAGMLVEKVSGRTYWGYLDAAFFGPLGMRHSHACAAVAPADRAHGYRLADGSIVDAEVENWANPFAGGGLCSTAGDLLLWQAALDGGRALSPASVRLMRTPTRLPDGPSLDYGLGTRLGALGGHPVLGHTGGGQGFSTVLLRVPGDDLTVVVLRNSAGAPEAKVVAARLARRLLGLAPFAAKDSAVPADLLRALPGDWLGDYGPFRLKADGGRIEVELGEGGPKVEPPYLGGSTFAVGEEDLIRFVVEGGRSDWALEYVGGLFDSAAHRVPR
jgi:CubicO group peptidase (beta-lactamase class C family)